MSPAGGAGLAPVPQTGASARAGGVKIPSAWAARAAIASASAVPDSDDPDYDDDHEPDMSDGWPDGWEDQEPDPERPIDDEAGASVPVSRKRQPIISYHRTASGGLGYRVAARHPDVQAQSNLFGAEAALRESRHQKLAEFLLVEQWDAIAARGPRDAYRSLIPLAQNVIAYTVTPEEGGSSWVSRSRDEVVECPWGTVPLDFFTWGIERSKADEYQKLLDAARLAPSDASPRSVARSALRDGATDKEVDRLRKLVPLALELWHQRRRLAELRQCRSCRRWHNDGIRVTPGPEGAENDRRLARLLEKRGGNLYRFAIAGWEPEGGDRCLLT